MNGSLRTRWLSILSALALSLAGGTTAAAGGPSPAPEAASAKSDDAETQAIEDIVPLVAPLFYFYSDMFAASPTTNVVVAAQQPVADPARDLETGVTPFPPEQEIDTPPVVRAAPEPATIGLGLLGWGIVSAGLLRRRMLVRKFPRWLSGLAGR